MIWNPLRWLTYFHPDSLGAQLVAAAFALVIVGGAYLIGRCVRPPAPPAVQVESAP